MIYVYENVTNAREILEVPKVNRPHLETALFLKLKDQ